MLVNTDAACVTIGLAMREIKKGKDSPLNQKSGTNKGHNTHTNTSCKI
jgi:hypothetical protein